MTKRILAAAFGAVVLASGSAQAADVDFTATLVSTCTLAVPTPGLMALNADGTVLSSEETGGLAAAATVLAIGSATVTVGAPVFTVTADAGNYDNTGEVAEVKYTGVGGLSLVDQAYTAGVSSFSIGTIPLSTLAMNAKVTNPNSFDAGAYQFRTTVTCS